MTKLPPAPWTQRDDLAQLVAVLGADNIRWVGGAVRDTLLGAEVKDIDAATPLPPAEVMQQLQDAGIKTIPTGIDHGTVTALLRQETVEITTLRRDVSTDGRRATVSFAQDWREDAARRDFTINALYAHPQTLAVTDYFGGLADLSARLVRFIGDAEQRIAEDHLRILRYYRFQARFGGALDPVAEAACAKLAPTLKGLSRERVAMELLALLALPDPAATLARMAAAGVLPMILPETGEAEMEALRVLLASEAADGAPPSALRRLAALLPPDPRLAVQVAARLRLSTAQRKRLSRLAERNTAKVSPYELAYREGASMARDLLLLAGQSSAAIDDWAIPVFPLKGGEIVARGVPSGPQIATILRRVEARWIAEGFPDRARVDRLLDEEIAR